jgi:hypothetical protein
LPMPSPVWKSSVRLPFESMPHVPAVSAAVAPLSPDATRGGEKRTAIRNDREQVEACPLRGDGRAGRVCAGLRQQFERIGGGRFPPDCRACGGRQAAENGRKRDGIVVTEQRRILRPKPHPAAVSLNGDRTVPNLLQFHIGVRAHCGTVWERLVKLFAQHGFSDGLTVEGLSKQLIDGVIFSPRDITRGDQLLCESEVTEDVSKVLECEAALPLTALIGPNIIIGRPFDSPEAAIAMNFVRATGVQSNTRTKINTRRPNPSMSGRWRFEKRRWVRSYRLKQTDGNRLGRFWG